MNKIQFRIVLAFYYSVLLLSGCTTGIILVLGLSAIWFIISAVALLTALTLYCFLVNPVFKGAQKRYDETDNDIIKFIETEIKEEKRDKDSIIKFIHEHTLEHYIKEELKEKERG